ncbi:MAG: hypothetical protein GY725_03330 [bacterium]|nr:hypothetical protein [bacterium]
MALPEAERLVTASLRHVGSHGHDGTGAHEEFRSESGEIMLIVADGSHDRGAGGVASALCVDALGESFLSGPASPLKRLEIGMRKAREAVATQASRNPAMASLGVSAVAMIFEPLGTAWLAWMGDCAAFRVRSRRAQCLTGDRSGADREEGATILRVEARPEDAFVLCSTELLGCLTKSEIGELVADYSPRKAVQALERRILSSDAAGCVTVQVASKSTPVAVRAVDWVAPPDDELDDIYARNESSRGNGIWPAAAALAGVTLLGGSGYALYTSGVFDKPEGPPPAVSSQEINGDSEERIARVRKQEPTRPEPPPKSKIPERVPLAEKPVAEVPVAEVPVAQAPVVEKRPAQVQVAKKPVAEVPVAQAPVVEKRPAQVQVAKKPVAEVPVAQAQVADPSERASTPVFKPFAVGDPLPTVASASGPLRDQFQTAGSVAKPARRPPAPAVRDVRDFLEAWERAVSEQDFSLYQSLGLQLTRAQFERSYMRRERVDLRFRLLAREVISPGRMRLRLFMTYSYWDGTATRSTERERSIEVSSTVRGLRYVRNLR